MNADIFYKRVYVFRILIIVIFFIFACRLIFLQLIDSTLKDRSKSNALLFQTIYPARGLIYDRNGEILVYNRPFYDIMVVTKSLSQDFDTLSFCSLVHISPLAFDSILKKVKNKRVNRGFSPYTPQLFLKDITQEEIIALQENLHRFKGVFLQKRYNRGYSFSHSSSHVLGSIGEVGPTDLEKDAFYQMGDIIGKDGIERFYEHELRGEKGVSVLLRDSKGQMHGQYKDGMLDEEAVSGKDLTLTLDIRLQQLTEHLLTNKVGSIVAIEPSTGEVLAMASSPTFDLGTLNSKNRNSYFNMLLRHPHKPLLNRASYATYSPGSCFKIVQALVCLQEGILTPTTVYHCNGPTSTPIRCTHYHGFYTTVEEAIEQSCNPFFWNAFRDLLQKNGYGEKNQLFKTQYNKWREQVMTMGLGHVFENSDILNQSPGNIPTAAWFDNIYGSTGWKAITIRSLSIGQGEILVTPLQLANIAAIVANNGYYITPHLRKELSLKQHIHLTNTDAEHFAVVRRGMRHVMQNGTGRFYDIPNLHFCGKTGTVQNNAGKDHALFIGFAPEDKPQIALAVVIENAGFGATWAVPIASLVMEYYLTGTISNEDLIHKMIETNLIDNE